MSHLMSKLMAYYGVEKTFNSTNEETFLNKAKRFPSNTEIALVPYTRMMQSFYSTICRIQCRN